MAFQNIKQEELQKFIALLDQVLYNHVQWHHSVIRTLICQLTPDKHEINPESYKECRLGQWYYSTSVQEFQDHPGQKHCSNCVSISLYGISPIKLVPDLIHTMPIV